MLADSVLKNILCQRLSTLSVHVRFDFDDACMKRRSDFVATHRLTYRLLVEGNLCTTIVEVRGCV